MMVDDKIYLGDGVYLHVIQVIQNTIVYYLEIKRPKKLNSPFIWDSKRNIYRSFSDFIKLKNGSSGLPFYLMKLEEQGYNLKYSYEDILDILKLKYKL